MSNTCLRLKKVPHIDFLESHRKQAKRFKRHVKSKNLCYDSMQDMGKWVGRWSATHLLHGASLDSLVNKAFLQRQRIMTREKCGGSCFTVHTLYYICCTELQKHTLRRMGKLYTSIHVRGHPVFCNMNHCFKCDLTYTHCNVREGVGGHK